MKQFDLVQVGNPDFLKPCVRYTKTEITSVACRDTVRRMKYTMSRIHGVGLAGPQLGIQKQLFVLGLKPTKYRPSTEKVAAYAVFNPMIISYSDKVLSDWEGCFSVAKASLFSELKRPAHINVRYQNENAQLVERRLEGLEARVFQHEYDHLHGKVFLEHVSNLSNLMDVNEYRAMREKELKA